MNVREKTVIIELSDAFSSLPAEAKAIFAEMLEAESFGDGDVICEKGELADAVFLIASGQVTVHVGSDADPVRTLGPGAVIGEYGLLSGGRRTASLKARGDVALLSVDNERFGAFLHEFPSAMWVLFRESVRRLAALEAETTRARGSSEPD